MHRIHTSPNVGIYIWGVHYTKDLPRRFDRCSCVMATKSYLDSGILKPAFDVIYLCLDDNIHSVHLDICSVEESFVMMSKSRSAMLVKEYGYTLRCLLRVIALMGSGPILAGL